ncbi:MAG: outer membrane protein assembly factor BamA [Pseudomonadales bacterium]|nr:outer membrane protein assembly factor BamA [Pseudomonadales bacterium]
MQRFFLSLVFAALLPLTAFAQSFTISDIRVEGLQRITAASVFGLLNVNVGDEIDDEDINRIIRDVFASDFFENIEVLREDNVLIIRVQERPSISAIEIDGNKMIKTEQLLENMSNAGLAVGQVFKRSTLEGMQLALQEQYVGQGLYGASVDVEVLPQERNRVAIDIKINEGDASSIVHINIIGNSVFDDEELLNLFEMKTSHFTSFFRKDDRYSREKINGDLERMTSYYMDQGYINFEITSTQVSVTPGKDEVYITVNISEGDLYTVDEVELAGDLVGSEALLRLVLQVRPGQVFSQQLITTSSEFMTQLMGNRGYFFAEIEGVPSIDEENKTVDVTFFVEPGSRTYVNRISFFGNTNTVDEVLRREMRQMEGAPASKVALEQSKVRLQRLGFFGTVEYETSEVPGTSDQINVDFAVEEQPSGSIGGSIGFAQQQGLILSANLQQNNFLGTGKQIGIGVNTSQFSTSYNFSYFDPYYTIDGVSRGFALSYSTSDFAELNLASFSTNQMAASFSYGYQLSEIQSLGFNFSLERTDVDVGFGAVQEIKSTELIPGVDTFIAQNLRERSTFDPQTGQLRPIRDAVTMPISELPESAFGERNGFLDREGDKFNNFTINTAWRMSTLNRGLFPTAGSSQSLSLEFTAPLSSLQFYKIRYLNEQYFPIIGDWVIHSRADFGFGDGFGSTKQLPFFEHFFGGGLGSVRGFEQNSMGPLSTNAEQFVAAAATFIKDQDGNIVLDSAGNPILDLNGEQAYVLEQVVDENGIPQVDENGNLVFNPKIQRQALFGGRPLPFGGNIQLVGTVELLFPVPFVKDRSKMRSAIFVDGGNIFSSNCSNSQKLLGNCSNIDLGEIKYSVGLSASYLSGFGMMTFSIAKPFNRSTVDRTESFQFTIGNTF